MLEYWYKEKRTLTDFRRGVLGPYFDGFAEYLKAKGYSQGTATGILGKCCQFNGFLIDTEVTRCSALNKSLIDSFIDIYCGTDVVDAYQREVSRRAFHHLFAHLSDIGVIKIPKPKKIIHLYSWILDPYLKHLRDECRLSPVTIQRHQAQLTAFLAPLGRKATRKGLKSLTAEYVEKYLKDYFTVRVRKTNGVTSSLRGFFQYASLGKYIKSDFSGLIPTIKRYRHASLPKGMEDSALDLVLKAVNRESSNGARDYAVMILMMAYGIRGISVAELLLDDIDWQNSRIRIRAQKGGKEVVLPLMDAVGEAIIQYLPHRNNKTPFRELFLSVKAPFVPLSGLAVSRVVHTYMKKAGVKMAGGGTRTLRHSWAIRALASGSPIKSIADVLGHRYINTTFIYAKADLKMLREVAMPWPKKD